MNSTIETLNQFGGQLLQFAWPMLWQSSLLIVFVFALDFLLGRKIRASVRYALWLAVLVKLLLPPALALPTGAAWWLFHAQPAVKAPIVRNYTVTYDTAPPMDFVPPTISSPPPAPPKLTGAGWSLLATGAVSAALLLWLTIRWWQVARMVRGATGSEELAGLIEAVRQQAGWRSRLRLKLVAGRMSPAVCGLFRPVILLPRTLVENLSAAQLRAVLLHEMFHLRRLDVWVNCAQALLQIFYWWHPLLWFANARIRRLREEAVDDAVMLALRDDADNYAPTLLEVAKLAFRRPLLSLGLVGIMESRSALRQRIERLVDFRAPRRAGLTFASLCGIFVFSAVALPMGEAPNPAGKPDAADPAMAGQQSLTVKVNPEIFFRNLKTQAAKAMQSPTNFWGDILMELLRDEGVDCNPPHGLAFTNTTGEITTRNTPEQLAVFRRVVEQLNRADGICELPLASNPLRKSVLIEGRIYPMSDEEFDKFTSGFHRYSGDSSGEEWWSVPPDQFQQLINGIEASGLKLVQRPRIQTGTGMAATLHVGDGTNSLELACKPHVGKGFIDLALESTVVSGAPVNAFTNHVISQASAEDHGGVVLRMTNYGGYAGSNLVVVVSAEVVTSTAHFRERLVAVIKRGTPTNTGEVPILVQDGKLLYEMGKLAEAEVRLNAALSLDADNAAAKYYLGLVQSAQQRRNGIAPSQGRQDIVRKLQTIRLDHVAFEAVPLGEVLRTLAEESKKLDLDHRGINFLINPNSEPSVAPMIDPGTGLPMVPGAGNSSGLLSIPITINPPLTNINLWDVLDALVKAAPEPIQYSVQDYAIVISPHKPSVPLYSRHFKVDTNTFVSALRMHTGMQTNNVPEIARIFFGTLGVDWDSPKGKSLFYNDRLGQLFVRATLADFGVIEHAFSLLNLGTKPIPTSPVPALIRTTSRPTNTTNITGILNDPNFRTVLHALEQRTGAETLAEPELVTTVPGRGVNVMDQGTLAEMQKKMVLNSPVIPSTNALLPQVHIKARFLEVPKESLALLQPFPEVTNGATILSAASSRKLLQTLKSTPGTVTLAEPEVVTTSGRQTQMRATQVFTIVTNFTFQETSTNAAIVPQTGSIETGPILDEVATVLPDGNTIDLRTTALLTEFLGYDNPTNTNTAYNSAGEKIEVPKVLPKFRRRQASAHLQLWDDQTVVLAKLEDESVVGGLPPGRVMIGSKPVVKDKEVLVFITATIVDPAGNRVHPGEVPPSDIDVVPMSSKMF